MRIATVVFVCTREYDPVASDTRMDAQPFMNTTLFIVVVAVAVVLLVLGAGVIFFVMKSKGKKAGSAAAPSPATSFPPASQPGAIAAAPQAWSQPQPSAWGPPQDAQPEAAASPPPPAPPSPPPPPPSWGTADLATTPPSPPPSPAISPPGGYGSSGNPDPYATTPSVDPGDMMMPNPDLFMTTPSVGRAPTGIPGDLLPAHLQADDGSIIHLARAHMRVGRHPECDIVIPTPGTSRQHAEFEFRDGAWFVTDLNSGNGTWVNNVKVRSQQLAAGDVVRVDQTRFTFGPGF
jgi:hypothetical protein